MREFEALGNGAEARQSYERAAALSPTAQSPLLGLSRVADQAGDRPAARDAIARVLKLPVYDQERADPWWVYEIVQARGVDGLVARPAPADSGIAKMTTRLVAVSVAVLLGSAVAPSAQQPTFSAKRESVRVDVLVTDRGKVVTGLGAGDFEIRDNGVPQTVDLVSFQQIPLNVFLAFDVSTSVSGERLTHLQSAGHALLDRLAKDDRSALLTFSHSVLLREGLTGATARVRQALTDVQPLGDTALVDGAYTAIMLDPLDGGRNLLLVFSDGLDTASWLAPESVLDSAKRSDFVVYGVSSRGPEDSKFLDDLDRADRRSHAEDRVDAGSVGNVSENPRRVQTTLSDQLLADRRGERRLASARGAREGPARHREVAGRLPGGCVTRCRV